MRGGLGSGGDGLFELVVVAGGGGFVVGGQPAMSTSAVWGGLKATGLGTL